MKFKHRTISHLTENGHHANLCLMPEFPKLVCALPMPAKSSPNKISPSSTGGSSSGGCDDKEEARTFLASGSIAIVSRVFFVVIWAVFGAWTFLPLAVHALVLDVHSGSAHFLFFGNCWWSRLEVFVWVSSFRFRRVDGAAAVSSHSTSITTKGTYENAMSFHSDKNAMSFHSNQKGKMNSQTKLA